MAQTRRIYLLKDLPPEVKAVTFAKCSRSPKSFLEIAKELTEEKSAEFHEKWVVGYGHSSVAEHAVLSIAIENISQVATKFVEDNRLASYTEKSSRYQIFDKEKYYQPAKIMNSEFKDLYIKTIDSLFDFYDKATTIVKDYIDKKYTNTEDLPDKVFQSIQKGRLCDIIRFILPHASFRNLGMTINARNLEYAITKMLSSNLEEIKEIGVEIKKAAIGECPTLVKYADANEYLMKTQETLNKDAEQYLSDLEVDREWSVKIVEYDKEAENKLISALLYRFSKYSYQSILERVKKMSSDEKKKVIEDAFRGIKEHDRPLRELEHINYTFDILMDYSAFYDLQRHRICTQTNQSVTVEHGFVVPKVYKELNLAPEFTEKMKKVERVYHQIHQKFPDEAQYVATFAFLKRMLLTINLRELFHLIPLRSSEKGHPSYRKVAQEMYREVERVHPFISKYIRVYFE